MPTLVTAPTIVHAVGNKPKQIQEFVGRASTADARLSIARMQSPGGWKEPGQRPEFLEITVVLRGVLQVEHKTGVIEVRAGQAIIVEAGEWVRYATPDAEGAETVSVCLPAFSPDTVHRDAPCGAGHAAT